MKQKKMKALLCCVACTPGWGSEFGMGWNFAHAVSSFCEAHVIVAEEARRRLETYCTQHREQTKNLHFYYVSEHIKTKWWENAAERYVPTLYFYYKYRTVLRKVSDIAIELDKAEDFDIVHQVTLAGFRMPGHLWRLGKPLLWGPIGGMDNAPYRLIVSLRLVDIVGYTLRNIINTYQKRMGYAAKVYAYHSAYILTSTQEGERVVRNIWKRPGEYMCEIGTMEASELNAMSCSRRLGEPLRLCWAGIMNNQRKNLPLLFKALEYCDSPVELCVMGQGRLQERWKALSRKLPARHKVIFTGSLPQEKVFEQMRQSHIFCVTSVKDDTSSVLLEALQQGLPIIAPNSCGFAGVITEDCGIKIDIDWPHAFARAYGAALNLLAQDEPLRSRLARGALERAKQFTWEAKTARLRDIYTAIIEGRIPDKRQ